MSVPDRQIRVTVCTATFSVGSGSLLPHLFRSLSVRSRPSLCIFANVLYSDNLTPDQKFLHRCFVHGDEIDLQWDVVIPEKRRTLCLSFDLKELKKKITRILKKDQASLFIVQNRTEQNADKFDEEGSSDNFTIYVGRGTNDREGLQSVPAIRTKFQQSAVNEPANIVKLKIPVKTFRDMMGSFSKCKQDEQIKLTFYDGERGEAGILISSRSNLNTGNIIEKFGVIPEDAGSSQAPNIGALSLSVDDRNLVRAQARVQLVLIDPNSVCLQPNEFLSDPDKISHFVNFASLHNEGTVRVYYTPGADLKFAFRFGPYGEEFIYINNNGTPQNNALILRQ
jgi:hypothetical protein